MNIQGKVSGVVASLLSATALMAVLLFTAVPRLQAEDYERCQRRIAHADHELHLAIERHGRHSPQAEHKRLQLHEAREHCWSTYHRWWDEDEHRWHTERDWNEHDHDHD
jgi:hypothetical protein